MQPSVKSEKNLSPPKPAHAEPAKHEQGNWPSAASLTQFKAVSV